MAEQMLARFEELFRPIQEKIDNLVHWRREREFHEFRDNDEMQFQSVFKKPDRVPAHSSASTPLNPLPPSTNQPPLLPEQFPPSSVRAPSLPAKEQKVARSLPQEKMPQLLQIIRKRNEHLAQDGDEIELDIEALDTETQWELDRFVTNWKKMVSKTKQQALMMNTNGAAGPTNPGGQG
ncbi:Transcription factor GTE7 [Sesamum alatum]|uniref:Transcription factor GTE7 n=1 Tax=Sesamum alatum TaxID=300844 RepID=A0AAE1YWV2_9LAMI|nr:Transcription factor GTE7 [Sesamum alatum]